MAFCASARFCRANQFDFIFPTDVADVNCAPGEMRCQDRRRNRATFGVAQQRMIGMPVARVRQQHAQPLHSKRTESLIEIHLESDGVRRERGGVCNILFIRTEVESVIAARVFACDLFFRGERSRIDDGRCVVGHIQYARKSTRERGGGSRVPGFFVGRARLAQMDMRVNQAGQFENRHTPPQDTKKRAAGIGSLKR